MIRRLILTITALLTTLAILTPTATAGRLSTDDLDLYVIWDGADRLTFNVGGTTVACDITLLGSFHSRTIRKTARALIGAIEHVDVNETACNNGTADITGPLPWHLSYEAFGGTLPAITFVRLLLSGPDFDIHRTVFPVSNCRTGETNQNVSGRAIVDTATGVVDSLNAETTPGITIDDIGGESLCDLAGTGAFSGTGAAGDDEGNALVIRLI